MVKGCPLPETYKATIGQDQMDGREMVGQSISKLCGTISSQGSFNNESTLVLAPESEEGDTCVGA